MLRSTEPNKRSRQDAGLESLRGSFEDLQVRGPPSKPPIPGTSRENNAVRTRDGEDKSKKKRKRRSKQKENPEWIRSENTDNRELGQEYLGTRKIKNSQLGKKKWKYDVPRAKRELKPRCTCKLSVKDNVKIQCCTISEIMRENMNKEFLKLSWPEKRLFVCSNVKSYISTRNRNLKEENESRRTFSFSYFIPIGVSKVRVCKKMFINTFRVGEWSVHNWKTGQLVSERISPPSKKKKKAVPLSERRAACRTFLQNLVKMESHYCRASSSKIYLELLWSSVNEVYRTYVTEMQKSSKAPLSLSLFHEIFNEMNLKLYRPRKDQCEVCLQYEKMISADVYNRHRDLALAVREEKSRDKGGSHKVFAVDVQSVLLAPKNNSGAMYYKTKICVHNYSAYNLKTKEGICYVWNETDGSLQAPIFATMLCDLIIFSNCEAGETVIVWSDGCSYQNRNQVFSNALLNLAMQLNITIVQKFLVKGHSQMEVDSMHATIEQALRRKEINVPSDYCDIMRRARIITPYTVKYLNFKFFKNFEMVNFVNTIRPPGSSKVVDLRVLKYCASGQIFYKTNIAEDYQLLYPHTRVRRNTVAVQSIPFNDLPQLYMEKIKISFKKYQDLQALKETIVEDHHPHSKP